MILLKNDEVIDFLTSPPTDFSALKNVHYTKDQQQNWPRPCWWHTPLTAYNQTHVPLVALTDNTGRDASAKQLCTLKYNTASCNSPITILTNVLIDRLIDYLFAQTCHKTAQVMATEHEQDSQAPSALIAALIA